MTQTYFSLAQTFRFIIKRQTTDKRVTRTPITLFVLLFATNNAGFNEAVIMDRDVLFKEIDKHLISFINNKDTANKIE
jgi:hypothetical protein